MNKCMYQNFIKKLKKIRQIAETYYFLKSHSNRLREQMYLKWAFYLERPIVVSRCACLGEFIYNLRYTDKKPYRIHQQKTRFDIFLKKLQMTPSEPRTNSRAVKKHLKHDFVYPWIQEQEYLPWIGVKDCEYALIDSFAELTDQKFTHKAEGWSFCAHYGDIEHSQEFEEQFMCEDLLAVDDFEKTYTHFFDWFEKKYPGKHVFFFHYPTTLDGREKYKVRASKILEVMKVIEEKRPYIHNIYVEDSAVDYNEHDTFPYHYSKETNQAFLNTWIAIESSLAKH